MDDASAVADPPQEDTDPPALDVPDSVSDLLQTLKSLHEHLSAVDLETASVFMDVSTLREAKSMAEKALREINECGSDVLAQAARDHVEETTVQPMWGVKVDSFTDADTSYVVRWDIRVSKRHSDSVEAPEYNCSCPAFTFRRDEGPCKHITKVKNRHPNGEMPEDAIMLGEYYPHSGEVVEYDETYSETHTLLKDTDD